jgi:transcriptional regulator with XRE-family HTH domain
MVKGHALRRKPDDLVKKEIAQRLRDVRRRRGMTQVELANLLGTNQTYVSSIERANRGLTVQQLFRLCEALKISPLEILREPKHQKNNGAIGDRRFLRRLEKIDKLSKRQKENLLGTIDAFLKSANVR